MVFNVDLVHGSFILVIIMNGLIVESRRPRNPGNDINLLSVPNWVLLEKSHMESLQSKRLLNSKGFKSYLIKVLMPRDASLMDTQNVDNTTPQEDIDNLNLSDKIIYYECPKCLIKVDELEYLVEIIKTELKEGLTILAELKKDYPNELKQLNSIYVNMFENYERLESKLSCIFKNDSFTETPTEKSTSVQYRLYAQENCTTECENGTTKEPLTASENVSETKNISFGSSQYESTFTTVPSVIIPHTTTPFVDEFSNETTFDLDVGPVIFIEDESTTTEQTSDMYSYTSDFEGLVSSTPETFSTTAKDIFDVIVYRNESIPPVDIYEGYTGSSVSETPEIYSFSGNILFSTPSTFSNFSEDTMYEDETIPTLEIFEGFTIPTTEAPTLYSGPYAVTTKFITETDVTTIFENETLYISPSETPSFRAFFFQDKTIEMPNETLTTTTIPEEMYNTTVFEITERTILDTEVFNFTERVSTMEEVSLSQLTSEFDQERSTEYSNVTDTFTPTPKEREWDLTEMLSNTTFTDYDIKSTSPTQESSSSIYMTTESEYFSETETDIWNMTTMDIPSDYDVYLTRNMSQPTESENLNVTDNIDTTDITPRFFSKTHENISDTTENVSSEFTETASPSAEEFYSETSTTEWSTETTSMEEWDTTTCNHTEQENAEKQIDKLAGDLKVVKEKISNLSQDLQNCTLKIESVTKAKVISNSLYDMLMNMKLILSNINSRMSLGPSETINKNFTFYRIKRDGSYQPLMMQGQCDKSISDPLKEIQVLQSGIRKLIKSPSNLTLLEDIHCSSQLLFPQMSKMEKSAPERDIILQVLENILTYDIPYFRRILKKEETAKILTLRQKKEILTRLKQEEQDLQNIISLHS